MFDKGLTNSIATQLKNNHLTIAVAESVTAGLLQAALASATDASSFFQGGITAYNIGQKSRHLLVDPVRAIECDCVSAKVSEEMSLQVCALFTSNYGIGVTRYAARVPERKINQLFAYYSISFQGEVIASEKIFTEKDEGLPAQLFYVQQALEKLNGLLKKKPIVPVKSFN